MLILSLFAVFGAFCGLWLSVVGFAVTTVGLGVICGVANYLVGGPFTGLGFVYAVVALQLGYFATIALRSFGIQLGKAPSTHLREGDEKPVAKVSREPN